MIENYTPEFEKTLFKLLGGNIRRIFFNKGDIYYGMPLLLNSEEILAFEIKIEDTYYELKVTGFKNANVSRNIFMNKIWPGVFSHRLIFRRGYQSSFQILTDGTYSPNTELKIYTIEIYVSNYSDKTKVISVINIYFEQDILFEIQRDPNSKCIELLICKTTDYSLSSILEDNKLYKLIKNST